MSESDETIIQQSSEEILLRLEALAVDKNTNIRLAWCRSFCPLLENIEFNPFQIEDEYLFHTYFETRRTKDYEVDSSVEVQNMKKIFGRVNKEKRDLPGEKSKSLLKKQYKSLLFDDNVYVRLCAIQQLPAVCLFYYRTYFHGSNSSDSFVSDFGFVLDEDEVTKCFLEAFSALRTDESWKVKKAFAKISADLIQVLSGSEMKSKEKDTKTKGVFFLPKIIPTYLHLVLDTHQIVVEEALKDVLVICQLVSPQVLEKEFLPGLFTCFSQFFQDNIRKLLAEVFVSKIVLMRLKDAGKICFIKEKLFPCLDQCLIGELNVNPESRKVVLEGLGTVAQVVGVSVLLPKQERSGTSSWYELMLDIFQKSKRTPAEHNDARKVIVPQDTMQNFDEDFGIDTDQAKSLPKIDNNLPVIDEVVYPQWRFRTRVLFSVLEILTAEGVQENNLDGKILFVNIWFMCLCDEIYAVREAASDALEELLKKSADQKLIDSVITPALYLYFKNSSNLETDLLENEFHPENVFGQDPSTIKLVNFQKYMQESGLIKPSYLQRIAFLSCAGKVVQFEIEGEGNVLRKLICECLHDSVCNVQLQCINVLENISFKGSEVTRIIHKLNSLASTCKDQDVVERAQTTISIMQQAS
eukprot:snap_masked-scaffold_4-processed-gene-8.35-mRNA-1 protein AED:1.00 eAED:1.00 QI:0/0/0/0/1/1/3/0/637